MEGCVMEFIRELKELLADVSGVPDLQDIARACEVLLEFLEASIE